MTKKDKIKIIIDYFDEILPHAQCELVYHQDYQLLIAVMLSAQTTDKSVNKVTKILFEQYPTLVDLSKAKYDDVYQIIKSLGLAKTKADNVIKIAQGLLDQCDGIVPNEKQKLMSLPGVGIKTANVVQGELFGQGVIAVDTHVERIAKRLSLAKEKDTPIQVEEQLEMLVPSSRRVLFHHQMIHFGRYYCFSRNPSCATCKIAYLCSYYKVTSKQ
jgi:endonuclease-3